MIASVKKYLEKVVYIVAGNRSNLSLEHRVYNVMMLLAVIIAIWGAYYNYLLKLPPVTIYPSLVGALIGFGFYYLARFRHRYHNAMVIVPALLTILSIGIVFFYNAGSAGPIILLDICLFTIFIMMSTGMTRFIILVLFFTHVLLLYYLEYRFPAWISGYHNATERYIDVSITFLFSGLFLVVAAIVFKKKYNAERNQVEVQNIKLESSIREIQEKNSFIQSLMKELNHRVKNNLQLVTSLLNMQASQIEDIQAKQSIDLAKSRIVTIGLIHQKLYRDSLDLNIELSDYILELCNYLFQSSAIKDQILLSDELISLQIKVETAVHIGLIVNELITNTLKHAWPKKKNEKRIGVKYSYHQKDGKFELIYWDNGIGFNQDSLNKKTSGLDLIRAIAFQYDGKLYLPKQGGNEKRVVLYLNQE